MSEDNVMELDNEIWGEKVEKSKKPVMVMFYSPTCPHCNAMEPYFREYSKDFKDTVDFARLNIIDNQNIALKYGIMGTPTFKFFCKGKPIHDMVGEIYPSLIKKAIEEVLQNGNHCANSTTWFDFGITGYA